MTSDPQDPLSEQLYQWQLQPRTNPQFRTNVWAAIERGRKPATWPGFARAHRTMVAVLVAGGALVGAWGGRAQARDQVDADRSALAANYVHQMDARWMRSP